MHLFDSVIIDFFNQESEALGKILSFSNKLLTFVLVSMKFLLLGHGFVISFLLFIEKYLFFPDFFHKTLRTDAFPVFGGINCWTTPVIEGLFVMNSLVFSKFSKITSL